MDVAERLGPSLAWWLDEPFAFALWSYHQLQAHDTRRQFVSRMERLESAELMMVAFHEPDRLHDERWRILATAAKRTPAGRAADALARGERVARFIRKGKVLES